VVAVRIICPALLRDGWGKIIHTRPGSCKAEIPDNAGGMGFRREDRQRLSAALHQRWACTTSPFSDVTTRQLEKPSPFSLRRMKNEARGWTPGRISGK
jgi:hypothetical protein